MITNPSRNGRLRSADHGDRTANGEYRAIPFYPYPPFPIVYPVPSSRTPLPHYDDDGGAVCREGCQHDLTQRLPRHAPRRPTTPHHATPAQRLGGAPHQRDAAAEAPWDSNLDSSEDATRRMPSPFSLPLAPPGCEIARGRERERSTKLTRLDGALRIESAECKPVGTGPSIKQSSRGRHPVRPRS